MTADAPAQPGTAAHGGERSPARGGPGRRGFAVVGALVVLVVAGACVGSILSAREAAVTAVQSRLNLIAEGRVELLGAWRDSVVREAGRFADSQFLRAYAADRFGPEPDGDGTDGDGADGDATDGGATDGDATDGGRLAARGDYLKNLARDFVERTRFRRLVLVGPAGDPVLSDAASLRAVPSALATRAIDDARIVFGASRMRDGAPVVPVAYPVVRPQRERAPEAVVGAVVLEIGLRAVLRDATRLPDLAQGTETIRVLERAGDERRVLTADGRAAWRLSGAGGGTGGGDGAAIPFGRGDRDGTPVFLSGQPAAGLPWTVVVSTPVADALAGWRRFAWAAGAVAGGVALAVLAGLAGFWYRLSAAHARTLAERERAFAQRIDRERRLLDQITASVPELIGLKGPDGTYRYVNRALAAAAGRPRERVVGEDDTAVFGPTLAGRLADLDRDARAREAEARALEQVYLHGEQRHIRFSAQPFREPDAAEASVLHVGTDLTEIIRAEQERRAELERSVQALGRAVETVDPYLAGHSRRMERLATAVARGLRLSESEVTTVSLAARLSQVGKLGVRRELLTSAERHGPEEIREMQTHIDHAGRILGEINFQLPVRETVVQMHERLDGTGYPEGLSGEAIRTTARILGAVDVFCARIEPRSYRPPIGPQEALSVLRAHPERYDAEVVAALERVIASPEGDKALADLGG
jgi:PAS domain S-box-containing protein